MLPASRVPPPSRRAPNWSSEEARTWEKHHPQPTIPPPCLNRQAESRWQPVGCISRGREPGPTPAGKTLPHSFPETWFRREKARGVYQVLINVCCTYTRYLIRPKPASLSFPSPIHHYYLLLFLILLSITITQTLVRVLLLVYFKFNTNTSEYTDELLDSLRWNCCRESISSTATEQLCSMFGVCISHRDVQGLL